MDEGSKASLAFPFSHGRPDSHVSPSFNSSSSEDPNRQAPAGVRPAGRGDFGCVVRCVD